MRSRSGSRINGNDVFSKTMILAVFPELYAILSFACAFLALP